MKYIEEDNLKDGLEVMFGYLRDYYERLDEEEVKEVLIGVVKNGKDLKKVQERLKNEKLKMSGQQDSIPGSLSSGLMSPPESRDGKRQQT